MSASLPHSRIGDGNDSQETDDGKEVEQLGRQPVERYSAPVRLTVVALALAVVAILAGSVAYIVWAPEPQRFTECHHDAFGDTVCR